jgi:hypothetical protein
MAEYRAVQAPHAAQGPHYRFRQVPWRDATLAPTMFGWVARCRDPFEDGATIPIGPHLLPEHAVVGDLPDSHARFRVR